MADHCCICSETRSSFGHLEVAGLVSVGERLGVFGLLTLRMNRNTHSKLIAPQWDLPNGQLTSGIVCQVLVSRITGHLPAQYSTCPVCALTRHWRLLPNTIRILG